MFGSEKSPLCEQEIGGTIPKKKVRKHIKNNLSKNEELIATLNGGMKDYLAVTNNKIILLKAGLSAWASGGMGLKTKSYLLNQITGIHLDKRLLTCDLEISIAGMNKQQSGGFFSAAESESVVQFQSKLYDEVLKLTNQINELIDKKNNQSVTVNTGKDDPIAKIEKLSGLKDKGIITEEEFEEKKRALLKKIE